MHQQNPYPTFQDEKESIIKNQLSQIKLLQADNQLKTQQVEILKDKIREIEEFNTIYKKQLANVEAKLKMYDQELKLKLQSSEEKSYKLLDLNQALTKKNQQMAFHIQELQEKNNSYEQELNAVLKEVRELRANYQEMEEETTKLKNKIKAKDEEIDSLSKNFHEATVENQELHEKIAHLTKDNEKIIKVLEENEEQLKRVSKFQQQYKDLQSQYEQDSIELETVRKSYDSLKKKYDDLFYDYNIILLNKKEYDDFVEQGGKQRLIAAEKEMVELRTLLAQKEREVAELKDQNLDLENEMKEKTLKFETEIKRAINLMDGETTTFPIKGDTIAIHLLLENIARQNREQVSLNEKLKQALSDIKELKLHITQLMDEKNEIRTRCDDYARQNDNLLHQITLIKDESARALSASRIDFEEKLKQMARVNKDTEDHLNGIITKKEDEIKYLEELVENTKTKLSKAEEEKKRAIDFLREQEAEIKEFKEKFFQIAEETSQQKVRINRSSYIIATLLKILFNLLSKFDSLVHQKAFLSQGFNEYTRLKEKLISLHLVEARSSFSTRRKPEIWNKFRKVGFVVLAANRLRRLQLKQIGLKSDSFEVRHALEFFPEGLKRFFIDLFRSNKFIVDKDLVTELSEVLRSPETEEENAIVSKLIATAHKFNRIPFDPSSSYAVFKSLGRANLEELKENVRLREDLHDKLMDLEVKLKNAEDYIKDQEIKFNLELDNLTGQLRQVLDENSGLKKELEKLNKDLEGASQYVDEMIELVDDKRTLASFGRDKRITERCGALKDQVLTVVKSKDYLEKEVEAKNLRILELEKEMLQKSITSDDMIHVETMTSGPRDLAKAPGKIMRSSDRKNTSREFYLSS